MKFVEQSPFAEPAAAARKLVELVLEGKVTDRHPTESRFVVRKDAQGKWMIWDRSARRPGTPLTRGVATTGLSEEEARQLLEQLRRAHGEK